MTREEFLEKIREIMHSASKAEGIAAFYEMRAAVNEAGEAYVERSNTIKDEIMKIVTKNNRVSAIETPAIVFALEAVTAAIKADMSQRAELVEMYNCIKGNVEIKNIIIPCGERGEGK